LTWRHISGGGRRISAFVVKRFARVLGGLPLPLRDLVRVKLVLCWTRRNRALPCETPFHPSVHIVALQKPAPCLSVKVAKARTASRLELHIQAGSTL